MVMMVMIGVDDDGLCIERSGGVVFFYIGPLSAFRIQGLWLTGRDIFVKLADFYFFYYPSRSSISKPQVYLGRQGKGKVIHEC